MNKYFVLFTFKFNYLIRNRNDNTMIINNSKTVTYRNNTTFLNFYMVMKLIRNKLWFGWIVINRWMIPFIAALLRQWSLSD